MFSDKEQNIFTLLKAIENDAIASGATSLEINGLGIQELKLMNEAAIKRLGFSYEKLDDAHFSISETLPAKKP